MRLKEATDVMLLDFVLEELAEELLQEHVLVLAPDLEVDLLRPLKHQLLIGNVVIFVVVFVRVSLKLRCLRMFFYIGVCQRNIAVAAVLRNAMWLFKFIGLCHRKLGVANVVIVVVVLFRVRAEVKGQQVDLLPQMRDLLR